MEVLEKVQEVLKNPFIFARGWKSQNGQRIIGVFVPDAPEELIYATGMLPFTILDGNKSQSPAGVIPSFTCSLISNTFDRAYHRQIEFLDGMVIPYLCDSSRALFHLWQRKFPERFSDLIRLPKKLGSQGTKTFLVEELRRFKRTLEKTFGVEISNEEIRKSIDIYDENRRHLRTIQAVRFQNSDFMSNYDFFSLVKTSMLMPKKEHNEILREVLARGGCGSPNDVDTPVKVFLSGILVEPLEIFRWMDEMGMVVAYDDLAVGSRYFSYEIENEGDPLEALAESYFNRIPNPTVEGGKDRFNYILDRVQGNNLEGVIFIQLKFCEPLIFDYPDLKKGLDREGIPNLLIETDLRSFNVGQLKTRLQAFAEILGSRSL